MSRSRALAFALAPMAILGARTAAMPSGGQGAVAPSPSPAASTSPRPVASPPAASPSPTPRYRLIPYAFGGVSRDPTPSDLLRFEDQAEVRALEMNEAIARFFEDDETFTRGATGGADRAPSRSEMEAYRPGMSPSINLLLIPQALIELGKMLKRREERKTPMPPAEPTPEPTPVPDILDGPGPAPSASPPASPTPSPSPGASPTPRATPTPRTDQSDQIARFFPASFAR